MTIWGMAQPDGTLMTRVEAPFNKDTDSVNTFGSVRDQGRPDNTLRVSFRRTR